MKAADFLGVRAAESWRCHGPACAINAVKLEAGAANFMGQRCTKPFPQACLTMLDPIVNIADRPLVVKLERSAQTAAARKTGNWSGKDRGWCAAVSTAGDGLSMQWVIQHEAGHHPAGTSLFLPRRWVDMSMRRRARRSALARNPRLVRRVPLQNRENAAKVTKPAFCRRVSASRRGFTFGRRDRIYATRTWLRTETEAASHLNCRCVKKPTVQFHIAGITNHGSWLPVDAAVC